STGFSTENELLNSMGGSSRGGSSGLGLLNLVRGSGFGRSQEPQSARAGVGVCNAGDSCCSLALRLVSIEAGTHKLGPDNAALRVRTGRRCAAAMAGHDLRIHRTPWGGAPPVL